MILQVHPRSSFLVGTVNLHDPYGNDNGEFPNYQFSKYTPIYPAINTTFLHELS